MAVTLSPSGLTLGSTTKSDWNDVGGGNFINQGGRKESMNQGGTDPYSNAGTNDSRYKTVSVPAGGIATVHMGSATGAYITTRYGTALRVCGQSASSNPALDLEGYASGCVVVNTSTSSAQSFTVGSNGNNYLFCQVLTIG